MTNTRISYSRAEHQKLYLECQGVCPLCSIELIHTKGSSKSVTSVYEIAHIYPLNPTQHQKQALITCKPPTDPNSLDNLILLCPTCHTKYDKDFVVEDYKKLICIKDAFRKDAVAKSLLGVSNLDAEITELLEMILDENSNLTPLDQDLESIPLDEKLRSNVSYIQKREIQRSVVDYYVAIRDRLQLIEKQNPMAVRIFQGQIKVYSLQMQKVYGDNKDDIFMKTAEWISSKTGRHHLASRILTAFFVQNCEVFSVDPE